MNRYENEAFDEYQRHYEGQYEPHLTPGYVLYEVEELCEAIGDKEEQLLDLESEIRMLSREIGELRGTLERLTGR